MLPFLRLNTFRIILGFQMTFKRADRVSEAIKREVSVLLTQEAKDPGIHFVTVTGVETSDDLRYARIFVSVLGDEATRKETLEALNRAKGFLRGELGRRVQLRYTPEIQFHLDTSLDHAFKIKGLLDSIKSREAKKDEGENKEG
jgi:ribosome-binding factor A